MAIVEAKQPVHSAGHRCATLNWLGAFRRLGWDIWIIENIRAEKCVDQTGVPCPPERSINRQAWDEFSRLFGFDGRSTLFVDGKATGSADFRSFTRGADLFLNYSGQFNRLELVEDVKVKAYLDVDPGYLQVWVHAYGCKMNFTGHDAFITIGALMGRSGCRVPDCGLEWIATLPPAPDTMFQRAPAAPMPRAWSTVAHWYSGTEIAYDGITLRPKHTNFELLRDLPGLITSPVEVASDMQPGWGDYVSFRNAGWSFRDVSDVCASIENYRDFIVSSAGELGVPKGGYVALQSGWMSDRSMVYLANGRPVITLDTGWTQLVGEHAGLRVFSSAPEAARCIREIELDYDEACASARQLAETVFSGKKIVASLLSRLGLC